MVAMEVREEDGLDVARVDADSTHVRKQRRTAIEEQTAVHHHSAVVPVRRKCGAGTEEGELYAMVTDGLRYTS
ncbi:MAG: hypothetical protein NVS1B3_03950 [Candidatus Dormibacteraceae bacterium]